LPTLLYQSAKHPQHPYFPRLCIKQTDTVTIWNFTILP
jgi:hypothetical protein